MRIREDHVEPLGGRRLIDRVAELDCRFDAVKVQAASAHATACHPICIA